jgi:hypothetical protein
MGRDKCFLDGLRMSYRVRTREQMAAGRDAKVGSTNAVSCSFWHTSGGTVPPDRHKSPNFCVAESRTPLSASDSFRPSISIFSLAFFQRSNGDGSDMCKEFASNRGTA